jgi:hypothetical protein
MRGARYRQELGGTLDGAQCGRPAGVDVALYGPASAALARSRRRRISRYAIPIAMATRTT